MPAVNYLNEAFQLFDAYNRQDPHKLNWNEEEFPAEYFYALQLYNWVKKLAPEASEALLLASRCQHIGRWKIPRDQYPLGKAGYLRWRTDLAKFHAATAAELLKEAGYNESEINQVQHILLKQNLKNNDEVQTMENALCLVFLEFQYEDFISKHDDTKLVRILQKSLKKMSEPGRNAALTLTYSPKAKILLASALAE
jgi:hypothetical protein